MHVRLAQSALILSLLTVAWMVCAGDGAPAATADTAAPSAIQQLRSAQAGELDSLRNSYDYGARTECPRNPDGTINKNSAEYKRLVREYTGRHEKIRQRYLDQLPDDAPSSADVDNTGSKRKDVRSDGDYTAKDDAAYQRQKQEWEGRGGSVSDKGHKARNETTDETLWKADPDGRYRDAKISDPDAMGTPGGQKSVGVKRGITDAEGATLDHEKKYLDGKRRGDLKDQAKAMNKAGEQTGRVSENPDLYDKNRKLQQYGDDVTAGITDLGDTPAERARKIEAHQRANDAELERIKAAGRAQGERGQRARENLRDQTRRSENAGDDAWNRARNRANYDGQQTTSEAIGERIDNVNDANRATAEQNARTRAGLEGKAPRGDAPDGGPRVDGDAPRGPRVDLPDAPRGPRGDLPDAPRSVKGDLPDAPSGAQPGKMGKALDVAGKGMMAVDTFATAEDVKEALKEGDMKKLRGTLAEGADGLAGSPVATGRMVKDRLVDAHGEKNDEQAQARAVAREANEQQMRVDLRKGGFGKEEVDKIMDAAAKGDDEALKAGYAKIGKEMPKPVATDPTVGESLKNYGHEVVENTDEVVDGMAERTAKAGRFVKQTGKDLVEIGSGLTEDGVVDQIRENQKDNWSSDNLKAGADHIYTQGRQAVGIDATDEERLEQAAKELAEKMVGKGVSPTEAEQAARQVMLHPDDTQAVERMRDLVREADPANKMIEKGVDPDEARAAADNLLRKGDARSRAKVRELVRDAEAKKSAAAKAGKSATSEAKESADEREGKQAAAGAESDAGADPGRNGDGGRADDAPRNDAGQVVDAAAYDEGDRIVTADGREFERKDGQWSATGENYGAYQPDGKGLKGAEPAAAATGEDKLGGAQSGGLDGFVEGRAERTAVNGATARDLMGSQHDLAEAGAAGDQAARDARLAVNAAGQDARNTQDKSSAQAAAAEREESLGKAVADGLQKGVETGLAAAGGAFGREAAEHVADKLFDDDDHGGKHRGDKGGKGGAGVAPADVRSNGQTPPRTNEGRSSGGKRRDDGDRRSGAGKKNAGQRGGDGERGVSSTAANDKGGGDAGNEGPMVTCPGCGRSFRGVAGQGVECPYCVTMNCPVCGFSKNYPRGQEPGECPRCAARAAAAAAEARAAARNSAAAEPSASAAPSAAAGAAAGE